ncbi:MAG: hypothetical protein WC791_04440 [Candidatus Paceibacterota bacterium]|jgi:hypothetical protein
MERFSQTFASVREHFGAWLRVALILIILSCLFFVAGGGVSHNEKWRINQINISGTDMGTSEQIHALVGEMLEGNYYFVYARNNSHLIPINEIEKSLLETYPRLLSTLVSRTNEHTISIAVTERKPYALWCGEVFHPELSALPDCWFIDSDGFIFDEAPMFSRGVYIYVYGKLNEKNSGEILQSTLPSGRYVFADNFAKLIQTNIGKPFQIEISPEGQYSMTILSSSQHPFLGWVTIRFDAESSAETLLKNLTSSIAVQFPDNLPHKKQLLYIDMRFGNKVIFGFEE